MRHHDTDPAADPEALRFNNLWDSYAGRVLAYARRRVDPDAAQEILSDTLLVDGDFWGWFPTPNAGSAHPVLTGYAADGTVVGKTVL